MIGPFWRYYGGKHRAAPRYPAPRHGLIVEPFAGAAGYACRYPDRDVLLIDKSPIIAGIWRWLIEATPDDVRAVGDIPEGGTVDDIEAPQEARWLAGFWCNNAVVTPCKRPSKWSQRGETPHNWAGWNARSRDRIARDVLRIKHWRVVHGSYTDAPDVDACWFVDPPYSTKAGSYYPEQPGDFTALGQWCRERPGQVIVCEQEGADWLPFEPFGLIRGAPSPDRPKRNAEVYWTKGCEMQASLW